MTTSRRALTALATGALTLPFLSVPAAFAVAPEPPAQQSINAVCANVPADYNPFTDDEPNTFTQAIECVAFAGITQGLSGGSTYGPGLTVRRDQMASFIARLMDTADSLDTGTRVKALPQYDNSNAFTDVDAGNVHLQAINRLEAAGIVDGGPGGRPASQYGPALEVTRAQMASFINRAIAFMKGGDPANAGTSSGYSSNNDYFTDDEGATAHERNINGIASRGIAVGDGRDTYNPGRAITRDQMAGFLARTLGALHQDGDISPVTARLSVTPDDEVTLAAVPNTDTNATDDRTYTASGLTPGQEYRITLVLEGNVTRNAAGEQVFAEDGTTGLAATGTRTADITTVDGQPAQNNMGDGTTRTNVDSTNGGSVVFTADNDGTSTFVVDGDQGGESVLPVAYRNGGPNNTDADGGQSPRLELNDDGTAAEEYDTGGVTNFTGGTAAGATAGPDLVSVSVDEATNRATFTFDEAVVLSDTSGASFGLYDASGAPTQTGTAAAQESTPDATIVVTFDDVELAVGGNVEEGAVMEPGTGGMSNRADEVPVSGQTVAAGRTAGPDLIAVSRTTQTSQDPITLAVTTTAVTISFVFDEEVTIEAQPVTGQVGFFAVSPAGTSTRLTGCTRGGATTGGDRMVNCTVSTSDNQQTPQVNEKTIADAALAAVAGSADNSAVTDDEDTGNPEGIQPIAPRTAVSTDAPDLTGVQFVATTGTAPNQLTTVRFVFDENLAGASDAPVEGAFHLYRFDGSRVDARDTGDPGSEPDNASVAREPGNDRSVLVVFDLDPQEFAEMTLGTVDAGAVQDSSGQTNPIGDAALTAFAQPAGATVAPDLTGVRNLRPAGTTPTSPTGTLVDFVFDEAAFVADEAGFQLVLKTGEAVDCEAVPNATTGTDAGDFTGDGTTTITAQCALTEDDAPVTAADLARGVVSEGAVSDADPTTALGTPSGASGNENPLQAGMPQA